MNLTALGARDRCSSDYGRVVVNSAQAQVVGADRCLAPRRARQQSIRTRRDSPSEALDPGDVC